MNSQRSGIEEVEDVTHTHSLTLTLPSPPMEPTLPNQPANKLISDIHHILFYLYIVQIAFPTINLLDSTQRHRRKVYDSSVIHEYHIS